MNAGKGSASEFGGWLDATVAYANAHYVATLRLSYISRLPNGHSPVQPAARNIGVFEHI